MPKLSRQKSFARIKEQAQQKILNAYHAQDRSESEDSGSESDARPGGRRINLDNEVRSEDDEEIDSDEAFGSDGELPVGKRYLSEEEEEDTDLNYDSVDEGELVSLTEAWDRADSESVDGSDQEPRSRPSGKVKLAGETLSGSGDVREDEEEEEEDDDEESEDEEEEDDDEEEEEENHAFNESDLEADEEKLQAFQNMLSGIANTTKDTELPSMAVHESEYAVGGGSSQQVSVTDLLSGSGVSGVSVPEGKSRKLAIPLPKRQQERLDRAAAFKATKKELHKWSETVSANRQAERLLFPLPSNTSTVDTRNLERLAVSEPVAPTTELERKTQELLEQSKLTDETALVTFEQLAPSKLSVEELQARRHELRMMRELAFREERKARRVKKIKSKSYRRVHRKDVARQEALMADAGHGSGHESEDEEARDRARAEERMSLRHKANSKWARDMIGRGMTKDTSTRSELEEMLRRGESLRNKVKGVDDDEAKLETAREVDAAVLHEGEDKLRGRLGKGVLNMKFMRVAEEQARTEPNESDDGTDHVEEQVQRTGANRVINEGRLVFAPGAKEAREQVEDYSDSDEDSKSGGGSEKPEIVVETRAREPAKRRPSASRSSEPETNPWLDMAVTRQVSDKPKAKRSVQNTDDRAVVDLNETLEIGDVHSGGTVKFQDEQHELIKQAFADDDLVDDFEEQKKRKVEEDGDQEEDVTLPGWGSWGGSGARPAKRFIKRTKGVAAQDRRDARLENVIINEKQNPRLYKYAASAVPFPYENREQYERSLLMPLGQEWSTRTVHDKLTTARINIKQGMVIDPIKAPFQ